MKVKSQENSESRLPSDEERTEQAEQTEAPPLSACGSSSEEASAATSSASLPAERSQSDPALLTTTGKRKTLLPDVRVEALILNPSWRPQKPTDATARDRNENIGSAPVQAPEHTPDDLVIETLVTRTLRCLIEVECSRRSNLVEPSTLDMVYCRYFGIPFINDFCGAFPDLPFSDIQKISGGEILVHTDGKGLWRLSRKSPPPQMNEFTGVPQLDKWLIVNRIVKCLEALNGFSEAVPLCNLYQERFGSALPSDCIAIFGNYGWAPRLEYEARGKMSISKIHPFNFRLLNWMPLPRTIPFNVSRGQCPVLPPPQSPNEVHNPHPAAPVSIEKNTAPSSDTPRSGDTRTPSEVLVDRTLRCLDDLGGRCRLNILSRDYQRLYGISFLNAVAAVGIHHFSSVATLSGGRIACSTQDREWWFEIKDPAEGEKKLKEEERDPVGTEGKEGEEEKGQNPPSASDVPRSADTRSPSQVLVDRTLRCLDEAGGRIRLDLLNRDYQRLYGISFLNAVAAVGKHHFSFISTLSRGRIACRIYDRMWWFEMKDPAEEEKKDPLEEKTEREAVERQQDDISDMDMDVDEPEHVMVYEGSVYVFPTRQSSYEAVPLQKNQGAAISSTQKLPLPPVPPSPATLHLSEAKNHCDPVITRTMACLRELETSPGELFKLSDLNQIHERKYGMTFIDAFWKAFPSRPFLEIPELSGGEIRYETVNGVVKFGLANSASAARELSPKVITLNSDDDDDVSPRASVSIEEVLPQKDTEEKEENGYSASTEDRGCLDVLKTRKRPREDERDHGPVRFPCPSPSERNVYISEECGQRFITYDHFVYEEYGQEPEDPLFLSRCTRLPENFTTMVERVVKCLRQNGGRLEEMELCSIYSNHFGGDLKKEWKKVYDAQKHLTLEKKAFFDEHVFTVPQTAGGSVYFELKKDCMFKSKTNPGRMSIERIEEESGGICLQNDAEERGRVPGGADAKRPRCG